MDNPSYVISNGGGRDGAGIVMKSSYNKNITTTGFGVVTFNDGTQKTDHEFVLVTVHGGKDYV